MTCGKVSKFLDAKKIEVKETVPASRKLGKQDAAKLVREASRVIVAKGKNVRQFPGGKATAEIVDALLGPTGNLRAPTVRVGKTLLVGFDAESFSKVLGR
jgi:arsenate reductase-like glutaredoxin family protein